MSDSAANTTIVASNDLFKYLEKYGFDIPFTEKELSLIGRDLQFCKGDNDEIEKEMMGVVRYYEQEQKAGGKINGNI